MNRILSSLKGSIKQSTVVNNSFWLFTSSLIAKIGSLIFSIIIARSLLPEGFGLYNLALGTILLFVGFTDLGINTTLINFISKLLGKNNLKAAKNYTAYLIKIKLIFLTVVSLIVIILSKYLAFEYYQKPIYLALLVGVLYIWSISFMGIIDSLLQASNYFKAIAFKETILQTMRIILVPGVAILLIKAGRSLEEIVASMILTIAICILISSIITLIKFSKKISFIKEKSNELSSSEKSKIKKFTATLSAIVLSGIFFSYVDKVMLGRFISLEYIGYYSAGASIIGAIFPLVSFMGGAILPVLSRLNDKKTEEILKISKYATLIFSVLSVICVFLFSEIAIKIIYGVEYLPAINVLKFMSILILVSPLIGIYSSYLISRGRPGIVSICLIISTLTNIFLNWILISRLSAISEIQGIYGAISASIISNVLYVGLLIILSRKVRMDK